MLRLLGISLLGGLLGGCDGWGNDADPYDLDFEIPRSEAFPAKLSAYGLYAGPAADLEPADGVVVYELSSELYTDHAYKQRLIRVPAGSVVSVVDGALDYPEGTVMAKTFYYPEDMQIEGSPKRILETRLLVKTEGVWNVATYLWNAEQTDATVLLDGTTTDVAWTGTDGAAWSTTYAVPHEGECVTCHQADGEAAFIGPTLRNLNRDVTRDGVVVNQLDHLVEVGVLEAGTWGSTPSIPNYKDAELDLETRARAYLDANCAHCHRPSGWDGAGQPELDLRYETALEATGLQRKADDLVRQLEEGEMPYLGVTLPHDDGIDLVIRYVEGLPAGEEEAWR